MTGEGQESAKESAKESVKIAEKDHQPSTYLGLAEEGLGMYDGMLVLHTQYMNTISVIHEQSWCLEKVQLQDSLEKQKTMG